MDKINLIEDFEIMIAKYHNIKNFIRLNDKYRYEQWKAGGFLIDDDIISMYPNLNQIINNMTEEYIDE